MRSGYVAFSDSRQPAHAARVQQLPSVFAPFFSGLLLGLSRLRGKLPLLFPFALLLLLALV